MSNIETPQVKFNECMVNSYTIRKNIPTNLVFDNEVYVHRISGDDFRKLNVCHQKMILDHIESNVDDIYELVFYRQLLNDGSLSRWICGVQMNSIPTYQKDLGNSIHKGCDKGCDKIDMDSIDVIKIFYQIVKSGGIVVDECCDNVMF